MGLRISGGTKLKVRVKMLISLVGDYRKVLIVAVCCWDSIKS